MANTALEKISGMGGFYLLTGTGAWTGTAESVVINEDAVFTVFSVNSVDKMTTKNLSGNTITAGNYLPTDPPDKITAITLASGSVLIYY